MTAINSICSSSSSASSSTRSIQMETGSIAAPDDLVSKLSAIEGPLGLYCWYEGVHGLPRAGADFWRENFFIPLLSKKSDATFYLYSLKGWDFQKKVTRLSPSSPLGNAINQLNIGAVKCIYAFDFFKYCQSMQEPLSAYIKQRIPKEWLTDLSRDFPVRGVTVREFFENQPTAFDPLNDQDVSLAYSHLRYVEGYYLIRSAVERGLAASQKSIQVAFVLPNDEGKYYDDFQSDVEKMLELEFGSKLSGVALSISMHFFKYGDLLSSRPYIDKSQRGRLTPDEVPYHFSGISMINRPIPEMPRDMYHCLND